MTKLSIVLIFVCSIVFGISSFAEQVDDNPQPLVQEDQQVNLDDQNEDVERAGGRANAQASANAQSRFRPGVSNHNPAPVQVRCYTCTDCPTIQPNVSSKICPPSFNPARNRKCVFYKEKYNHMKKPWTVRGCASERGSCAEVVAAHFQQGGLVKLLSCDECEGHLCNTNGVSRSAPSFVIAALAMLVTPLLVKNLLA